MNKLKIESVNGILLDLGLSSDQIEKSARGFGFNKNEPLLMTFSGESEDGAVTARIVVNDWSEETLADILYGYADGDMLDESPKKIVEARQRKPIENTFELVEIIKNAVPAGIPKRQIAFRDQNLSSDSHSGKR